MLAQTLSALYLRAAVVAVSLFIVSPVDAGAATAATHSRADPFVGVLAAQPAPQPPAATLQLTVHIDDNKFSPSLLTASTGVKLTLTVYNRGLKPHSLAFTTLPLATETLDSGESTRLSFVTPTPGRYPFYCAVEGQGNRAFAGMLEVVK